MGKRGPALHADQLAFTFDSPKAADRHAGLAGLDRTIAAGVALALKDDPRSREEIARSMSALLGEEVSRWMLDAYASEARDQHNISAGRFLALMAVTERFDVLDQAMTRIGARVLVGEEFNTVLVGHLRAKMQGLKRELRAAERLVRPIQRGGAL